MPVDHIRYDLLVQDALRGMVRNVLTDAAKNGLIGDHHFFIIFDTAAEGVQLSERLRAQYPEEMKIVLQHQFWGLKVSDHEFEVGLSFSGVPEKLVIPFAAIKQFEDPAVQFQLQFETLVDSEEDDSESEPAKPSARTAAPPEPERNVPASPPPEAASAKTSAKTSAKSGAEEPPTGDQPERSGAEVVRLDRFRKK